MITLKAEEIARLINRNPKYVYTLLRRKGISLSMKSMEQIFDLICRYRKRNKNKTERADGTE